jgi:serine kinase of HPr protein (carbohydrate metabolism regulator)
LARYELLGTPVAVEAADAGTATRIAALLEPFAAAAGPVEMIYRIATPARDRWRLHPPDGTVTEGDPATVEAVLVATLNRLAIERYQGFAVHAGVIALGSEVVCFPAASGVGKSTLTAACVRSGFAYVSDEALCLERETGEVVPYPRSISLSPESCALLGLPAAEPDGAEVVLPPAFLGAELARSPLQLTHVVQIERCPGPPRLAAREPIAAVSTLLAMSFNHYRRPADSVEMVASLARRARTWHLTYGNAPEAAALLRRRFVG